MSDWVNTNELATLLERHIRIKWYELAERADIHTRQLTRIRSRETTVTSFDIADRLLTAVGLNSSIDIETEKYKRVYRRKYVLNKNVKRHGTTYAYGVLKCGCSKCRNAHLRRIRRYRAGLTNKAKSAKVTARTSPGVSGTDTGGVTP